jgi:hypothetical protein
VKKNTAKDHPDYVSLESALGMFSKIKQKFFVFGVLLLY